MRPLAKLASGYRIVAALLLGTLIVFVLANLLAWGAIQAKEYLKDLAGVASPVWARYGERMLEVYPGRSRVEINALLVETWGRPQEYESVTGLREAPFAGRYVNVDAAGFRRSAGQGPWPPDAANFNLFVFGGSTTFGYGLADAETVPSALQAALDGRGGRPVRVYNFGRGNYHSTRERLLFEKLLAAGVVPDAAVFVDGLNEFVHATGEGADDRAVRAALSASLYERSRAAVAALPLARVADWVWRNLFARPAAGGGAAAVDLDAAIDRYYRNAAMIAAVGRAFGVPVLLAWHPLPSYRTDAARHPFPEQIANYRGPARGYARMRRRVAEAPLPAPFAWCADVQDGLDGYLYVDAVHFSQALVGPVADCIAAALAARVPALSP